MSYRSRRSRNVQASNVKDTTIQSVEDILSQVIHDAAPGEVQAPETLLSSSCNQTDRDVKTMTHPTQGTTTEADDVGSNKRSRARRHSPSPSHPLAADPPRQLRSSLRYSLRSSSSQDSGFQQVHDVADEGVQHPALSSRHNNKAEDPAMTLPTEATTMEPNDVRISQSNPSEGRPLPPQQLNNILLTLLRVLTNTRPQKHRHVGSMMMTNLLNRETLEQGMQSFLDGMMK